MNKSISTTIALAILASGIIGLTTTSGTAFAEPNNEIADGKIHDNRGFGSDQDIRYHEGTCQGGSDSEACDFDIITDPGNSDENRNDD